MTGPMPTVTAPCEVRSPVWRFLKKLNTELLYDPAILPLGLSPKDVKVGTQTLVHPHSQQPYSP